MVPNFVTGHNTQPGSCSNVPSDRPRRAAVLRFDSVTDLLESCSQRFPQARVETERHLGQVMLRVRGESLDFTSLIAHFEGSRCYMVEFPLLETSS